MEHFKCTVFNTYVIFMPLFLHKTSDKCGKMIIEKLPIKFQKLKILQKSEKLL